MNIPFLSFEPMHRPIKAEMQKAFEAVYDSYWYVLGARVTEFETAYAAFNRTAHCVGLSNGLDALVLSLKALGIGEGHEVIVPSNTYIATVLAVTYVGATPVFVEPDERSFNIDPSRIGDAVTPRTRAILPVHLYGLSCDMTRIMDTADRMGLYVVEDNAQSHGATFDGRLTGSWGHINGTSFYPGKNLGALGDAGAVTTDDPALADKVKVYRNYGSRKKYYNEVPGNNMRLDELQAALLSVKLPYLMRWTEQRQRLAALYDNRLRGVEGLRLPEVTAGATHVYHLYVVRAERRDALQEHLTQQGIGTLIHYPIPPHLQEAYVGLGYKAGDFPIAEKMAETCLSLPLWPGMTEMDVDRVAEAITGFYKQKRS